MRIIANICDYSTGMLYYMQKKKKGYAYAKKRGKSMGRNTIPSKIRLLEIFKLLQTVEKKDALTQAEIHAVLEEKYHASVSLNSITDDVRALEEMGLAKTTGKKKIARDTGRGAYGRFDNNNLEAWELLILTNAISQIPWIPRPRVYKLRNKLLEMTSESTRALVRKNLTLLPPDVYERDIFFIRNLNDLLQAIGNRKKISFHYSRLGKRRTTHGIRWEKDTKDARIVSPYKVYINDGKFYMVGFNEQAQELRAYRVDRIGKVMDTGEPATTPDYTGQEDLYSRLDAFVANNTDNFLGKDRTAITIRWEPAVPVSVLYDVMGTENVFLLSEEDNTFSIRTYDTTGLMNNLLRLGSNIEILEPAGIRSRYLEIIDAIRAKY